MGAVRPGLVEQAPAADDPALDFLQPQLAAELDRLAGLVAADDLAVRLEQAHDLLPRPPPHPCAGPGGAGPGPDVVRCAFACGTRPCPDPRSPEAPSWPGARAG